ncbi:hypothetical protein CWI38_1161p0010 [Hamiltosporidium tvaerminnensis]|uniref:Uncharacterized protein n=1 Tax=Hamiltosporidium tvaerminnensis TaxID=1176355 RepID=A0A4Q9LUU0_9MICR|nr:hypothetical protein CWI38_1161p0010 [Hamiltosporidium tvaerminnensis]
MKSVNERIKQICYQVNVDFFNYIPNKCSKRHIPNDDELLNRDNLERIVELIYDDSVRNISMSCNENYPNLLSEKVSKIMNCKEGSLRPKIKS